MNEKGLQILEQYEMKLLRSFGGRGSVMLETEQGLMLLKEFAGSKTKLPYEQQLLSRLEEQGVCEVDQVVPNREGELVSVGPYETRYLIKRWPSGRECDTKNEEELLRSMRTLARIHQAARGVWEVTGEEQSRLLGENRREEWERQNRELKRVRNFIRAKHKKGEFELLYLKYADEFLKDGENVLEALKKSDYEALLKRAIREEHICHGEYIHHNLLMSRAEIAAVNFSHCEINVQVNDICLFLRKIMEKQNWNAALGERMLTAYEKEMPLTSAERTYLGLCLSYPEKVWKLVHHYYHTNKAWIPEKSTEKLGLYLAQEERRRCFLKNIGFFSEFSGI